MRKSAWVTWIRLAGLLAMVGSTLPAQTRLIGQHWAQYGNVSSATQLANLADGSSSTVYLAPAPSAWMSLETTQPFRVASYSLTSAPDSPSRDPRSWVLWGSNDGWNWTAIDQRSWEGFSFRRQRRVFQVTWPGRFVHHLLQVTSNHGSSLLQIAEWELLPGSQEVVPSKPENVSLKVLDSRKASISWTPPALCTGYLVQGSQDGVNFENLGTLTSTAKGCVISGLEPESRYFCRIAALGEGGNSAPSTLEANMPGLGDWRNFTPPTVTVQGVEKHPALAQAIPDLTAFTQELSRQICKELYVDATSPRPQVSSFTLHIDEGRFASSSAWGTFEDRHLSMTTQQLDRAVAAGKLAATVQAILTRELVHCYQNRPAPMGPYEPGEDRYGLVEGLWHAVDNRLNPSTERRMESGGHWTHGHSWSGEFITWLTETRDASFIKQFNQSVSRISPWTWEGAIQDVFGPTASVEALWSAWQSSLPTSMLARFEDTSESDGSDITYSDSEGSPTLEWEAAPGASGYKVTAYSADRVLPDGTILGGPDPDLVIYTSDPAAALPLGALGGSQDLIVNVYQYGSSCDTCSDRIVYLRYLAAANKKAAKIKVTSAK